VGFWDQKPIFWAFGFKCSGGCFLPPQKNPGQQQHEAQARQRVLQLGKRRTTQPRSIRTPPDLSHSFADFLCLRCRLEPLNSGQAAGMNVINGVLKSVPRDGNGFEDIDDFWKATGMN
jgi:hypothetical protein